MTIQRSLGTRVAGGILLIYLMTNLMSATAIAQPLPRSTPEKQGVSSAAIRAFVTEANESVDSLHSFMIVRHGHVIAEGWWAPYRPEIPHSLYSLSKSFTSTAVGLAASEGKLSIDDKVVSFFPEDVPADASSHLNSMRISDLLRMSTGHQSEPSLQTKDSWVKSFLQHPVPFQPGTHFVYNTPATYMQSAIVQKVTGETLLDYLTPRLFQPLGIEGATWDKSPQGISTGGYGLSLKTEDIAKFGQLYLQKGQWNGKQIVPQKWIEEATARQTSNGSDPRSDWHQGYGYQFWRCRHGAYRGDGAFGQYCIVLPEQDAVIAITSGLKQMQPVLDLVWDKLLPSMESGVLNEDQPSQQQLQETLSALKIPLAPSGENEEISDAAYQFPTNEMKLLKVMINGLDQGKFRVTMVTDSLEQSIECSQKEWSRGELAWMSDKKSPVATCIGQKEDTLVVRVCFVETPFVVDLQMKLTGEQVLLNYESNVGFGPTRGKEIEGRLAK